MKINEDIKKAKKDLNDLKEQSLAMEILREQRKSNKRLFIALIVVLCMWFATIGGFLYYINTTDYVEITETAEVENQDGDANACVGDNCNNGDVNYGKSESN